MTRRIAVQMDPPASLNPAGDSTIALLKEAARRDYDIFYYDVASLTCDNGAISADCAPLTIDTENDLSWYVMGDMTRRNLDTMDVILVRQDPPFDMHYITGTYMLDLLPPHVHIINRPSAISRFSEKLLPFHCAGDAAPDTLITSDSEHVKDFLATHHDIIVKPLYGWGGHAVLRLKTNGDNVDALLEMIRLRDKQPIIAQPFLPEVATDDIRVITIGANVAGAFARAPADGEIRANMRVGGSAITYTLNDTQRSLCEALAVQLNNMGLYLTGIDLIGNYLTEINVTSPTGVKTLEILYNATPAAMFWDGLEQTNAPQITATDKEKRRWWPF